jgi:hypothetical protein
VQTQARVEARFLRQIRQIVSNMDRKIASLELVQAQKLELPAHIKAEMEERNDAITKIVSNMTVLSDRVETLAEAGKIDESTALMALVDDLSSKRSDLKAANDVASQHKNDDPTALLTVCPVCAAMLAPNEGEPRMQSHLTGKSHTGFLQLRAEVKRLDEKFAKLETDDATAAAASSSSSSSESKGSYRSHRRESSHGSSRRSHDRYDHHRDRRRRSRSRSRSSRRYGHHYDHHHHRGGGGSRYGGSRRSRSSRSRSPRRRHRSRRSRSRSRSSSSSSSSSSSDHGGHGSEPEEGAVLPRRKTAVSAQNLPTSAFKQPI